MPVLVAACPAIGANPTPRAFSTVFTLLLDSTIEDQENPRALFKSGGFHEMQQVINKTEHVRPWICVTISGRPWQKLPKADEAAQVADLEDGIPRAHGTDFNN